MAPGRGLSGLFLFTLLCAGEDKVSVSQAPLIQVTLAKENATVTCSASFALRQDSASFSFTVLRIGPQGQETVIDSAPMVVPFSPALENTTKVKHTFHLGPMGAPYTTGNYYCMAKWPNRSMRGQGSFIHYRETGYVNSTLRSRRTFLITTCALLAVLSLVGTGLLLLWWKKDYPSWSCLRARQANGGRREVVTASPSRPEVFTSGSIYTSLAPHSAEVYDILEQKSKIQFQEPVLSSPPQHLPMQQLQQGMKNSQRGQTGGKTTTGADVPQHPSTQKLQLEIKKTLEEQNGGKKKMTTDVPQHPSTQKHQLEIKKSLEEQNGGKTTKTDVPQHPSTQKLQLEIKKSLEEQNGGNKKTTTDVPQHPSTQKLQLEIKKSLEEQHGGKKKKKKTDVKPQPAAAQEGTFDTVYENL